MINSLDSLHDDSAYIKLATMCELNDGFVCGLSVLSRTTDMHLYESERRLPLDFSHPTMLSSPPPPV